MGQPFHLINFIIEFGLSVFAPNLDTSIIGVSENQTIRVGVHVYVEEKVKMNDLVYNTLRRTPLVWALRKFFELSYPDSYPKKKKKKR